MPTEKCYPSWRYHATEDPRLVNDAEQEKEIASPDDGWKETPADLPPAPDPGYCQSCGQKLPADDTADGGDGEAPAAAPATAKRNRKPKSE